MNEKTLMKEITSQRIDKIKIKQNAIMLGTEKAKRKGEFEMKKIMTPKRWIMAGVCLALIGGTTLTYNNFKYINAANFLNDLGVEIDTMTHSDVIKVYEDIESQTFEHEITYGTLNQTASQLGIVTGYLNGDDTSADVAIPGGLTSGDDTLSAREIYDLIIDYNSNQTGKKITSEQVKLIKSGMTYDEIISILGETEDVGSGRHVLKYIVDEKYVLYISYTEKTDRCELSGDQLLETLEPAEIK